MKITGPGGGPGAVAPPTPEPAAERSSAAREAEAPRFAELLAPEGAGEPAAPSAAIGEISARLRAGEISPAQASELLIDAVVRARVPALAAELQEQLRATLRRLLAEDPLLAAKVRRLTEGR